MRSRGSALRVHAERALRVLALTALAYAAWLTAQPEPPPRADVADVASLREALDRWTANEPGRAHVSLDAAPERLERDWLRALRGAGTPVTWSGDDIPALAIEVAPVAHPRGGALIWMAAAPGERVAVSDAIAAIDTVTAREGGATLRVAITVGPYAAENRRQRARAVMRDSILPRRVLVLGRASWEGKFVIAALEEAGWPVDARLSLAPDVEVTQGARTQPDTARHAAVVVLDAPSSAASSAVARYARQGGGVVLTGASASAPPLRTIAPGRVGVRVRPSSLVFAEDAPRRALGFLAIAPEGDAVVVEAQAGRVAVAARRADLGRVVQVGYDESWRWRLGGGANALDAHRAWWSTLVSGVAYRAAVPVPAASAGDPAPLSALVHTLGLPEARAAGGTTGAGWSPPSALLFALVATLLLAEIASRRLRGAA
ncbi:MAG: hypothetical protein ACT4PJ_15415 [Gemmatimonadaceae bacterium]